MNPEIDQAGRCSICGAPRMSGSEYCEDCAAMLAEEAAKEEARQRRKKAKADREHHLAELAEQGCGCASEAECQVDVTDWSAVPKSRSRKLYEEMSARCMRCQRWRAEAEERERQWRAERDERRRQTQERWAVVKVVLEPSPLLTSLRRTVLANRHDRCPKWRFRLAHDLVVQIQPRPAERRDNFYLFDCLAIRGENIGKEAFASRAARRNCTYIEFGVLNDPEAGGWRTDPHAFNNGADAVMQRLAELLPLLEVIDPRQMFSANCLICGKPLTDPASMARWIGPECAGTASLDAGLVKLKEPAPQGALL